MFLYVCVFLYLRTKILMFFSWEILTDSQSLKDYLRKKTGSVVQVRIKFSSDLGSRLELG